jgi:ABC-type Mn2+/Zn2+ transport system permease subunit
MLVATVVAAGCTTAGLFLSFGISAAFALSVPPGPLIILLAVVCYGVSGALRAVNDRR